MKAETKKITNLISDKLLQKHNNSDKLLQKHNNSDKRNNTNSTSSYDCSTFNISRNNNKFGI